MKRFSVAVPDRALVEIDRLARDDRRSRDSMTRLLVIEALRARGWLQSKPAELIQPDLEEVQP